MAITGSTKKVGTMTDLPIRLVRDSHAEAPATLPPIAHVGAGIAPTEMWLHADSADGSRGRPTRVAGGREPGRSREE
jgi:hypothetical protein